MAFTVWKTILLEWANRTNFFNESYQKIEDTDIETFFGGFKRKITSVGSSEVSGFIKDKYPWVQFKNRNISDNENKCIHKDDYMVVYTLFLHYACVRKANQDMQTICSVLCSKFQAVIAKVFNTLLGVQDYTLAFILGAIEDAELTSSPPSALSASGPLSALPFESPQSNQVVKLSTVNHGLRAQLELEREFQESECGYFTDRIKTLEEQLCASNIKVKQLEKKFKSTEDEMLFLESKLIRQTTKPVNNEILNKNNGLSHKSNEVLNLQAATESLNDRVASLEEQIRSLNIQNQTLIDQKACLEEQISSLQTDITDSTKRNNYLVQSNSELNEIIQDLRSSCKKKDYDSSFGLLNGSSATNTSMFITENLANTVVDVQLANQRQEIQNLIEQLECMRHELAIAKDQLTSNIAEREKSEESEEAINVLEADRDALANSAARFVEQPLELYGQLAKGKQEESDKSSELDLSEGRTNKLHVKCTNDMNCREIAETLTDNNNDLKLKIDVLDDRVRSLRIIEQLHHIKNEYERMITFKLQETEQRQLSNIDDAFLSKNDHISCDLQLRELEKEKQDISQRLTVAQGKIKILDQHIVHLQNQIVASNEAHEQKASACAAKSEADMALNENKCVHLSQKVQLLELSLQKVTSEYKGNVKLNEALSAANNHHQNIIFDIRSKLNATESEIIKLKSKGETDAAVITNLQSDAHRVAAKCSELKEKCTVAMNEVSEQRQYNESLSNKNATISERLAKLSANKCRLEELQHLKAQTVSMQHEKTALEEKLEKVVFELNASEKKNLELNDILVDLRFAHLDARQTKSDQQCQTQEIARMLSENAQLKITMTAMKARFDHSINMLRGKLIDKKGKEVTQEDFKKMVNYLKDENRRESEAKLAKLKEAMKTMCREEMLKDRVKHEKLYAALESKLQKSNAYVKYLCGELGLLNGR